MSRVRDAQLCLAAGMGRWEPIADWSAPPYILLPNTYEPASARYPYAPHMCDRGKPSARPAIKWRWVPEGPGCSSLRLQETRRLAAAFCRRHAGSSILVAGSSVMVPMYIALVGVLDSSPRWHHHYCQEGVSSSAVSMEWLHSAHVCGDDPKTRIKVQYLSNELGVYNKSRETSGEDSGKSACDDKCDFYCKRQLPFIAHAARSDFVLLESASVVQATRPISPWLEGPTKEARKTLEALAALRPRPRVIIRGPPFDFPPGSCKRMRDPLPEPYAYNMSDPSVRASRAVVRFQMHLNSASNEEARAAVDAYAASAGKYITFLDILRATAMRPGGRHSARKDCTHWCLPGPVDDWVRLALAWWLLRDESGG